MLFRVYPYHRSARDGDEGGALFVAWRHQRFGRHDNPENYGAFYAARTPLSAVAERLHRFAGRTIDDWDLRYHDGSHHALVAFDDAAVGPLVDLDEPRELLRRRLKPSMVATHERGVTQAVALALYEEGHDGFGWWSAIEASWANVTLFAERAVSKLVRATEPQILTVEHPVVQEAADTIGVRLV